MAIGPPPVESSRHSRRCINKVNSCIRNTRIQTFAEPLHENRAITDSSSTSDEKESFKTVYSSAGCSDEDLIENVRCSKFPFVVLSRCSFNNEIYDESGSSTESSGAISDDELIKSILCSKFPVVVLSRCSFNNEISDESGSSTSGATSDDELIKSILCSKFPVVVLSRCSFNNEISDESGSSTSGATSDDESIKSILCSKYPVVVLIKYSPKYRCSDGPDCLEKSPKFWGSRNGYDKTRLNSAASSHRLNNRFPNRSTHKAQPVESLPPALPHLRQFMRISKPSGTQVGSSEEELVKSALSGKCPSKRCSMSILKNNETSVSAVMSQHSEQLYKCNTTRTAEVRRTRNSPHRSHVVASSSANLDYDSGYEDSDFSYVGPLNDKGTNMTGRTRTHALSLSTTLPKNSGRDLARTVEAIANSQNVHQNSLRCRRIIVPRMVNVSQLQSKNWDSSSGSSASSDNYSPLVSWFSNQNKSRRTARVRRTRNWSFCSQIVSSSSSNSDYDYSDEDSDFSDVGLFNYKKTNMSGRIHTRAHWVEVPQLRPMPSNSDSSTSSYGGSSGSGRFFDPVVSSRKNVLAESSKNAISKTPTSLAPVGSSANSTSKYCIVAEKFEMAVKRIWDEFEVAGGPAQPDSRAAKRCRPSTATSKQAQEHHWQHWTPEQLSAFMKLQSHVNSQVAQYFSPNQSNVDMRTVFTALSQP